VHTVNVPPSADTFLNINKDVDGSLDTLNTYTYPANQIANAILMQFDLSSFIPAGATISDAQLYLYLVATDTDAANPTYVVTTHKLINFNPNLALATGYLYDGSNPWTDHAQDDKCCLDDIPLAQSDITAAYSSNAVSQAFAFTNWNLTTMVQEWMNSPASNYGVLLNSDPTKPADRYRFFASLENCDASIRPYLQVTYSGSPPLITPPTVSITSPASGATFTATANITINASASDSDGTISKVEFFQDCILVGSATASPYSLTVNNLPAGSYRLTAKATDNSGATTTSSNVVVTVNLPPLEITIGETAIGPLDDNGNGDLLLAQEASLPTPATIQSLSFYVTAAAGQLRLGIYDSTGPDGGPGAKKAEIDEITPVVGWNIANVVKPVSLPAGNYWLTYLPSSSDLAFRKIRTTGTGSKYYTYPYAVLPDTFDPQPPGSSISHWTLYATLTTSVPTITIGNLNLANRSDSGNGNLLVAQKASLSQTANLQSLSFYVTEYESGSLRLGLYDATGTDGKPGALMAATAELTPANGWNTANVITPVSLAPGDYWLAYLPSESGFKYPIQDGVGSFAYHPYDYNPMPDSFGDLTGGGTGNGEWLFYATLTLSAGPTLSVARSGNNITISWPAAASGFILESTASLLPGNWSPVTTPPVVVVGDQATVTIAVSGGASFYRLRK